MRDANMDSDGLNVDLMGAKFQELEVGVLGGNTE